MREDQIFPKYNPADLEILTHFRLSPEYVKAIEREREKHRPKFVKIAPLIANQLELTFASLDPNYEEYIRLLSLAKRLEIYSGTPAEKIVEEIEYRLSQYKKRGRPKAWWKQSKTVTETIVLEWEKHRGMSLAAFAELIFSGSDLNDIRRRFLPPRLSQLSFIKWWRATLKDGMPSPTQQRSMQDPKLRARQWEMSARGKPGRPEAEWRSALRDYAHCLFADFPNITKTEAARKILNSPEIRTRFKLPNGLSEKSLRNWLSSLPKRPPEESQKIMRVWAIPPARPKNPDLLAQTNACPPSDVEPPSNSEVAYGSGKFSDALQAPTPERQFGSPVYAVSERGSPVFGFVEVNSLSDAGQRLTADGQSCRSDTDPA